MNEPRRLHPLAMVFMFIKLIRGAFLPLLGFVFAIFGLFQELDSYKWLLWTGIAVLFFIFFVVPSFVSWYRYRYWVEAGELKIEHGIIVKHHRYIRKERIQSINRSANVLHRMTGLEKMAIETAGGTGQAEAELSAVTVAESKRLESALYKGTGNLPVEEDAQEDLASEVETEQASPDARWQLSKGDLLIAGMTSGKIGVVLAILGTIYSQVNKVIPEDVYSGVSERLVAASISFLVALVVLIAFIAWLLAVIGTVLRYAGFTVTRQGDELQIVAGLLERRRLTLPLHRIQAIRMVDGILRQPFGFVTVYVESAGGSGDDKEGSSIVLSPLLRRKEVASFLANFAPGYPTDAPLTPVPKRALRRYLLRILVPMAIIAAVVMTLGAFWFWPWGALALLLLPLAFILGYGHYRGAAWATTDRFRILRYRNLNRTTVIVPRRNIQTRTMSQSWFQKRGSLASYSVSVMSKMAGVGKNFEVDHLNEEDVRGLVEKR